MDKYIMVRTPEGTNLNIVPELKGANQTHLMAVSKEEIEMLVYNHKIAKHTIEKIKNWYEYNK